MPHETPVRWPQADVVTVNWNAGRQLADCIRSVQTVDGDAVARFIVVDNGSTDTSLNDLPDWDKLTVDRAGVNLGFGRGCNRGAAQGDAPYILLLNPDTRLSEGAITTAIEFLESQEGQNYGIASVMLRDDSGAVTRNAARFPTLGTFANIIFLLDRISRRRFPPLHLSDFDHCSSRPVDHVQGAFYLIRRPLFEALGGFDDEFFVYYEDLDLSRRAALAGGPCYFLADTFAWHRGGGTSHQVKARAYFYSVDARLTYAQKHFSRAASALHTLLTFTIEPFTSVIWNLYRHRGRQVRPLVAAYLMLFQALPRILTRRVRRVSADKLAEIGRTALPAGNRAAALEAVSTF
jgi:GT2 family glycosyltransferase